MASANKTLFLTVARQENLQEVRLMIDSLRTFGGELQEAPFWVFASDPQSVRALEAGPTCLQSLHLHDPGNVYLFERKVAACAQAEQLAPSGTTSLVWVDAGMLFTAAPVVFSLDEHHDAAFRPVHVRNVGLPSTEPLDAFWKGICAAAGVKEEGGTVTSFVDGQVLRTYYNSHAFSIRPALGLMGRWYDLFMQLTCDVQFQAEACADEAHQVFLFQALLSALVASHVRTDRLRILPPTYNYPYHLQERIPLDRRLKTLNETVCVACEDLSLHPERLKGMAVIEPLKSWLQAHVPETDEAA